MRADLHLHSVCSDGKYSPAEVVRRVKESGTEAFSLTDHDTMEGCEEAEAAAKEYGLTFVRGWEISAYDNGSKVHILGYGSRADGAYEKFLRERREKAEERAERMRVLANKFYGISVTMDEIEAYHVRKDSPIHTMHVVRAFAEKLQKSAGETFVEAFVRGKPAFSEFGRPSPEEAIEVVRDSGGVSVLAHPGRVLCFSEEEERAYYGGGDRIALKAKSDPKRAKLLARLVEAGLCGIECRYTTHTAEETAEFCSFAEKHGLIVTGGSDFHADGGRAKVGEPPFDLDETTLRRLLRGRE